MDAFSWHRNGFAACEEVRRCSPSPFLQSRRIPIMCPKPLRVQSQVKLCDTTDSAEILDILLTKDNCEIFDQQEVLPVASPPYFCGSPPVRAANPLVHDPGFLQGKHYKQHQHTQPTATTPVERTNHNPLTTVPFPSPSPGGRSCGSKSFGPTPAAVRIEGFSCLNYGGRSCSISTFA